MKVSVYVNHHRGPGCFVEGKGNAIHTAVADAILGMFFGSDAGKMSEALRDGTGLSLTVYKLPDE